MGKCTPVTHGLERGAQTAFKPPVPLSQAPVDGEPPAQSQLVALSACTLCPMNFTSFLRDEIQARPLISKILFSESKINHLKSTSIWALTSNSWKMWSLSLQRRFGSGKQVEKKHKADKLRSQEPRWVLHKFGRKWDLGGIWGGLVVFHLFIQHLLRACKYQAPLGVGNMNPLWLGPAAHSGSQIQAQKSQTCLMGKIQ